jgi:hypothetical protein
MKPSLREDLTSILAIGTGAFASGLLTAVLVARTWTQDSGFTIAVVEEPHVVVNWESQVLMAGPEGEHSAWFPEGEHLRHGGAPVHVRLESSISVPVHRRHP